MGQTAVGEGHHAQTLRLHPLAAQPAGTRQGQKSAVLGACLGFARLPCRATVGGVLVAP
jgi:hypothetical protein